MDASDGAIGGPDRRHYTSSSSSRKSGLNFDPTINLGHILTAAVFLASTMAAWFSLNARVDVLASNDLRFERALDQKADKESMGRGEVELSRRIVETQQNANASTVRIDAGFAEIKTILRDIQLELKTKADKVPGR